MTALASFAETVLAQLDLAAQAEERIVQALSGISDVEAMVIERMATEDLEIGDESQRQRMRVAMRYLFLLKAGSQVVRLAARTIEEALPALPADPPSPAHNPDQPIFEPM